MHRCVGTPSVGLTGCGRSRAVPGSASTSPSGSWPMGSRSSMCRRSCRLELGCSPTGQGRKTDATDAHSVALVGTRMSGLRPVVTDEQIEVLRLLVDRRRSLGEEHTRKTCQLHGLLLELIPGGAKRDLSAAQAKALLATVRPRDVVGKTRRRVAAELVAGLERIHTKKKAANKELTELVAATGTSLMDLHGIGPTGAARLLVEVGHITRFPPRHT